MEDSIRQSYSGTYRDNLAAETGRCSTTFASHAARLFRISINSFLLIGVLSCSRNLNPQISFDHARETFRHGDMKAAEEEAEEGYKEFHSRNPEWAWRFALLKARILYWRGMNAEVLNILSSEPGPPPSLELSAQKDRLQGVAYFSSGKFREAEESLSQAEQVCAAEQNATCGDLPSARGAFEMARGHFASAQVLFENALASARSTGDQFVEATALLNLSYSADEQTYFDRAIDWGERARAISIAHGYADIAQNALGNIGWAYYRLGDTTRAEEAFTEAAAQAAKLGDLGDRTKWLTNAAYIQMDALRFDAAAPLLRESLELARQINSREDVINSLIALAFISEQTGEIDDATRYASEALSMAQADGNKRDETYPRLVEGRVAARSRDFNSAEAAFNEVAASSDSPVFLKWEAERSLARLYEDENQIAKADSEYRTALTTFERARSELQHENSRLPFLNNATRIYDDYIHLLVSRGKIDQALQVANYSRARTLSEGLGLLKKASTFQPDPVNARETARRAGLPPSFRKKRGGKGGATATILFYWLGEKQSYLWAVTPEKVRLYTLPPAAEIDAAVGRYRTALLGPLDPLETSNADGLALFRMLVAPAAEMIPQHRATGDTTGDGEAHRGQRVFIIPDGSLNTLNFETLLVEGATPHYWIEDVTLADASSLRLLGRTQGLKASIMDSGSPLRSATAANADSIYRDSTALVGAASFQGQIQLASLAGGGMPPPLHKQLLLVGNAVAANSDYPELRKAAAEMESIAKHFGSGEQRAFARDQATPAAYLDSSPGQFSYIHFVAHGTASRMNPLDSAIVLSATGAQEDSFKLYARDIIQHPLRAQLVTISTCYGAGARAYSGEGLVGLSWAFLRAGAHNVIGALWEVSDVSTPQLMDDLYGELQKGRSPDAALRAAKLALLHSGTSFRRPFYWAPFQLYTGS